MGANAATLMSVAMGVQAINAASSAYTQSEAMKTKGDFEKQQADANARISDIKAADALSRGQKDANAIKRKSDQLKGTQTAALAANNVDIGSSTAQDLIGETNVNSELDMMTVRNNAWREAWGYKVQAEDQRLQGKFAKRAAKNEARATLITGGLQALSYGAQAGAYAKGKDAKNDLNKPNRKTLVRDYDKPTRSLSGKTEYLGLSYKWD